MSGGQGSWERLFRIGPRGMQVVEPERIREAIFRRGMNIREFGAYTRRYRQDAREARDREYRRQAARSRPALIAAEIVPIADLSVSNKTIEKLCQGGWVAPATVDRIMKALDSLPLTPIPKDLAS